MNKWIKNRSIPESSGKPIFFHFFSFQRDFFFSDSRKWYPECTWASWCGWCWSSWSRNGWYSVAKNGTNWRRTKGSTDISFPKSRSKKHFWIFLFRIIILSFSEKPKRTRRAIDRFSRSATSWKISAWNKRRTMTARSWLTCVRPWFDDRPSCAPPVSFLFKFFVHYWHFFFFRDRGYSESPTKAESDGGHRWFRLPLQFAPVSRRSAQNDRFAVGGTVRRKFHYFFL